MKQILFIGMTDKTDLLFYISNLVALKFKVLLVDATKHHNYEYTYPKLEMEASIIQHDLFDITERVADKNQLEAIVANTDESYDYIFIDLDDFKSIHEWYGADHYVLVTTYDNREIQRNLVLLEALFDGETIEDEIPFTRLICEAGQTFHEDYLDTVYEKLPIIWSDTLVYYPDERDITARINNQGRAKLDVSRLSKEYKKVLIQLAASIVDLNFNDVRQWWRQLERR
ncbi:hypothetical protein J2Z32_000018 [Paenibacillus turicensis]|uniref:AAA domain-containing protein n=1 Tax=Paenibacillus turicensis TaxID=160487 RepID=A0ABS4FLL0_9BACL|nr:hypothetical protein [Paenibacillus turicensis]MBP1903406.1 hypothetical protein [Paenibacillus turicensis]